MITTAGKRVSQVTVDGRAAGEVARAMAVVSLHESLAEAERDLEGLLQLAADECADLLGGVAALFVLDVPGAALRAHSHTEPGALAFLQRVYAEAAAQAHDLVDAVLRSGTTLVLSAAELQAGLVGLDHAYREYVDREGVSGLVVVPLASRGHKIGALAVTRAGRGEEFGSDDVALLEQLGRVVSLSIANAVLLSDVGKAQRRASVLLREDELTGLLNRRGFVEVLRERLAVPSGDSALVAVLDMDGFKLVNDGFGHATGDLVLASMAARLCAALPPDTPVARIGGDEFAVLVEAEDEEEAAAIVETAVLSCTGTITVVGLSVPMTVSVGTAVPPPGGADEVLLQADLAMCRAKRRGAIVAAYDPRLDDPATRRLKEVLALRRSIARGDLVVHYQPVVPVGHGPARVEALVRRNVDGQLMPPNGWLQMADRAGLMPEVTESVVVQVVEQLARWWEAGLEVECAVNVPAPVLTPEVVTALLRRLDTAGLPRRALSVEVTEGDLVGAQAKAALTRCADAHIDVAVDDFGTGFSALSYLVDLPLRTLKIDRTFVEGIDLDVRRAAVVRAVVDVAHELGLQVIAEGVETNAEAEVVIELGADALQGYLYGRPAGAADVEPALRSRMSASRS